MPFLTPFIKSSKNKKVISKSFFSYKMKTGYSVGNFMHIVESKYITFA